MNKKQLEPCTELKLTVITTLYAFEYVMTNGLCFL